MAKKIQKDSIEKLQANLLIIEEKIDNHPYRIFSYTGRDQEEFTIDLKMPVNRLDQFMKKNGASKNDIEFAKSRRKDIYQRDLYLEKANIKKKINAITREEEGITGDMFLLNKNASWILDKYGALFTTEEIYIKLKEEKGISVNKQILQQWRRINDEKIRIHITNHQLENSADKIRIGTDVGRLSILNKHLNYWDKRLDDDRRTSSVASKMVLAILGEARKETKGEVVTINGQIDIKASLQASDSVDHMLTKLHINSIIVGMVAAKQGVNPETIIGALTSSHYAKFNGFAGDIMEDEEPDLPGKIIKSFDWGNLEANVKKANPKPLPISDITDKGIKEKEGSNILSKMLQAVSNLEHKLND